MNLHGRTIAVTGAGGFIGSAAVAVLHAAGVRVRALDGPADAEPPPALTDVARWRADITDPDALRRVLDGAQCVLHLAGPPSVADSLQRPLEHARSHVLGTVNVLQTCRQVGIERLVYLSSAEVYGQPHGDAPVHEDAPLSARSPYGACKIASEQFIAAAAATQRLRPVILRPFSIYGPGMSHASLIGGLMRQAAHGPSLCVHDLRPVRDYCHIDDLVRALLRACALDTDRPLTLNVGTGHGTSVQGVVDALRSALRRELPVFERLDDRRPSGSEIRALVADIGCARQHLGWRPLLTLHDGLRQLVESTISDCERAAALALGQLR